MNNTEKNFGNMQPPKAPKPSPRRRMNPLAEIKETAQSSTSSTVARPAAPQRAKIEVLAEQPKSQTQPRTAQTVQPQPKPQPAQQSTRVQARPAQTAQPKVQSQNTQTKPQTQAVQPRPQPKQCRPQTEVKAEKKASPSAEYKRTIPGRSFAAELEVPSQQVFDPEPITHHNKRMRKKAAKRREENYQPSGGTSIGKKVCNICLMVVAYILTFAVLLASTALISIKLICGDTSPAAKELFVTTLLETGQMKSLATLFLSPEEVQKLVDDNTMEIIDDQVDSSLITIDPAVLENSEQADIEVVEISGSTFFATMLIVKDPSSVSVATIYPWKEKGLPIDEIVNNAGAVAGINGGLYNSTNNSGGTPYGVVVSNGEIQYNEPGQFKGFVLIGFTEDNILEIIPIDGYSKKDVENLVKEKKIRDAVCFQEEASDKNNHFVQLVINGEAREMNGMGSGLNPRTAIGQRADGSVLLLVTDGRGKEGHLGASASDLINVMVEYGAINAANLDGGSSSCMYYDGEYLMDSVTFYQANSSWKLPLAFVVK